MRHFRAVLMVPLAICVAGHAPARAQASGVYRIAPESSFTVDTTTAGALSGLGDAHHIVAQQFSGSVKIDSSGTSVTITIPTAGLHVADPDKSDETRTKVETRMKGADQLDIQKYPQITLTSVSAHPGARSSILTADITIHGVMRRHDFTVDWSQDGARITASGSATLLLSEFGIKPIKLALGTVQVKDSFTLNWKVLLDR